ncbi:MAG TPA: hypothetical protein VFS19_04255 [Planctomycetota bacterium]|nr:hypothetical protein [Planctomycetota bacterium]
MRVALLLLLLIPPQDPADPTLDQIIDRMEKAAAAARGTVFIASTEKGLSAEFAVAKDGCVRFRQPPPNSPDKPQVVLRSQEITVTPEAVYNIVEEWKSLPTPYRRGGLPRTAQKLLKSDGASIDPFTEKVGSGHAFYFNYNIYFYALSPRMTFGHERDLKLAGRRDLDGVECFLLTAGRPLDYEWDVSSGDYKYKTGFNGVSRKFYVRVSDYRLARMDEIFKGSTYVHAPRYALVHEYDGALPARTSLGIGNNIMDWKVLPTVANTIKRGLDIDGLSLRPDENDLYATRARAADPAAELAKKPADADLLYSAVVAESFIAAGKQAEPQVTGLLEKAVEARWAPNPVRTLLHARTEGKDDAALRAFLDRIEMDPAMAKAARAERVRARIRLGEFDAAIKILDENPDLETGLLWAARVEVHLRRLDYSAALKAFRRWPAVDDTNPNARQNCWDLDRVVTTVQREVNEFSMDSFLAALDTALAAEPGFKDARMVQLMYLARGGDLGRMADAVKDAMLASKDPPVHKMAAWMLQGPLMPPPRGRGIDAKTLESVRDRVDAALAAGEGKADMGLARCFLQVAAGDKKKAAEDLERLLTAAESASGPETSWVVGEAAQSVGDPVLIERTCRLVLKSHGTGGKRFDGGSWSEVTNPLTTLIHLYAREKRLGDLYAAMKGVNFQSGIGIFRNPPPKIPLQEVGAALRESAKADPDAAGRRWFARMILQGQNTGMATPLGLDAVEWLEHALQTDPRDLDLLQSLAEAQLKKEDLDAALKTGQAIDAELKAGRTSENAWSKLEARTFIAGVHARRKDKEAVKAALAGEDWSKVVAPAWLFWRLGEAFQAAGDVDRAIQLFGRCEEDGNKVYYQLAGLYLEKGDWMAAMRNANRTIAQGWIPYILKPGQMTDFGASQQYAREKESAPIKMREEILKKAGANYFLDRLLAAKLPLTAEESASAEKALVTLDSGTISEREAAIKVFRTLGPKSASILNKLLKDEESIWRTAARGLLNEWAEPR